MILSGRCQKEESDGRNQQLNIVLAGINPATSGTRQTGYRVLRVTSFELPDSFH